MTKFLDPTTHPALIYFFGPEDIKNRKPDDILHLKIGLSDNNPIAFNQRLSEHQRHCPHDVELAAIPSTKRKDAPVRHYLCRNFPDLFKSHRGKGREVIEFRAKDYPFLIEQATRFLNGTNTGNNVLLSYLMRHEQEDCCQKTCAFYSNLDNLRREFLWDCKMRFGKTHTAYQVISRCGFKTVLILTGRPTDTKKSWIEDLDHTAFDFGRDNFIDASLTSEPIIPFEDDVTIIFASLQDFDLNKEKFRYFANINFDLIIKDEYHLFFETERSHDILEQLNYKHILNLSGTAFRALLMERFPEDAIFSWSYVEEQKARQQEIQTLGIEAARSQGQYYWLAPLTIRTITLSENLYKDADLFTEEEGFTFSKLFATTNEGFRHDTHVNDFLNVLSHGQMMPYSPQSQEQYNTLNLKHTLWYVPGVSEATFLAEKLRRHSIFKQYKIVVAAGDTNDGAGRNTVNNTTDAIRDIEQGFDERYIGTITLTCGKLSHGVSIKQWGSVFCLSDMKSAALYFQLIFRCQTPWKEGPKEEGYVFDLNPNRILNYFTELAIVRAKTGNIKEVLDELLKVFNVLCYQDNSFIPLDASGVIERLANNFGRFNPSSTLSHIFDSVRFDIDDELASLLENIEDGFASKNNSIQINNHNNVPNGKNSQRSNRDNLDDETEETNDEPQKLTNTERQQIRIRMALTQMPTIISLGNANNYDQLVDILGDSYLKQACKQITGLSSHSLVKILQSFSTIDQQRINRCLSGISVSESKYHSHYQNELEG